MNNDELNVETNDVAEKAVSRAAVAQAPSADQLSATRAEKWHQDGKALLSLEGLRDWLTRSGLVLYGSRAQQLPAPAPSFVEATLGTANAAPDLAETENARGLLARLISDGVAVPLNLLGATGAAGTDTPDFVVSAAVFSYIFTLRGNKAWKQAPVTSGPVKVSPLALAAYEALSAKVMLSVTDLAHQLGSGVSETAVLRALTELWGQLRVIPVPQLDGSATLWELTTSRFTKQIKAGANAGQPSALSALISLYLGQAVGATEEEIETFLSPLAPRSRVRDVTHALLSARQLETLVVGGKTLLHVAGDVPAFAAAVEVAVPEVTAGEEGGSRITKFTARPGSKIGTGLRSKPAFGKKAFGAKPGFGQDRERRPFKREDRPTFNKPWEEDRKPAGEGAPRPFTPRPSFAKPRFEGRSEGFSGGSNAAGESRPPRREFTPRPDGMGPKKTFSKPGTFGRKREGFGGKPSFGGGDSRPPRRDFGSQEGRPPRREFGERPAGGGEFKRPGSYTPRPRGEFGGKPGGFAGGSGGFNGPKPGYQRDRAEGGAGEAPRKVFRKFDAPRDKKPFGDRKPFTPGGGARPPRSFDGPKSFDKPRGGGFDRPRGDRPGFGGDRPKPSFGGDRPRPPFGGGDRPRPPFGGGDRPRPPFGGGDRPRPSFGGGDRPRPAFGAKPGGFKKPFLKPGGGGFAAKGGPFAKFADGQKPFRKPGEKRAPRPAGGGFGPSKRKREDE